MHHILLWGIDLASSFQSISRVRSLRTLLFLQSPPYVSFHFLTYMLLTGPSLRLLVALMNWNWAISRKRHSPLLPTMPSMNGLLILSKSSTKTNTTAQNSLTLARIVTKNGDIRTWHIRVVDSLPTLKSMLPLISRLKWDILCM